jgi:maltose alpha-D-glucosyltransferase/alpha-amylase
MGDNIWLFDRNGVRTPMQWTDQPGTGFSTAEPWVPIIDDDIYGYQKINVAAQVGDPASLLTAMKHFIKIRKANPVLGNGRCDFLPLNNKAVLAYLRHTESAAILAVHNLSDQLQTTRFDLSDYAGRVPVDILDRAAQPFPEVSTVPYRMSLEPFDYFWLRLA